jgi:hypothetical protein
MYYTSSLFFMLSLGMSKISVVLFQAGLTANPRQGRIFRWLAGFIAAWMGSSILVLALQCDLSRPWLLVGQQCHHTVCAIRLLVASIGEYQC